MEKQGSQVGSRIASGETRMSEPMLVDFGDKISAKGAMLNRALWGGANQAKMQM